MKKYIVDTLEKINNGSVCSAFIEERPFSDSCEGCPLADEENLCTVETLIRKVEATMKK